MPTTENSAQATHFYPWQQAQAQRWLQQSQLAHAWLIYGQAGIGKLRFCQGLAKSLLCEHKQQGLYCDRCESCHWFDLGNHLDYRIVLPDALSLALGLSTDDANDDKKPSQELRIEQIRQLEAFMHTTTLRGGYRVVVLGPVESLNTASANAILKILEEPQPHTLFLLWSHAFQQVLPTIVSRCQRLPLSTPDAQLALSWLQSQGVVNAEVHLAACGGAPLKAYEQAQSPYEPVAYWLAEWMQTLAQGQFPIMDDWVERLSSLPPWEWLHSLQSALSDAIVLYHGRPPRFFPTLAPQLQALAQRCPLPRLQALYAFLLQQQRSARHPLNAKLFTQVTLQKIAYYLSQ